MQGKWSIFLLVGMLACKAPVYPDYDEVATGLHMKLLAFDADLNQSAPCDVFELELKSPDTAMTQAFDTRKVDNLPFWVYADDPMLMMLIRYLDHMKPGDSASFIDHRPGVVGAADTIEITINWKLCFSHDDFARHFERWLVAREMMEEQRLREKALEGGFTSTLIHPAVVYRIEASGEGKPLQYGDVIGIRYTGYFLTGQLFDDQFLTEESLVFQLGSEGQILTGLEYGLIGAKRGETRTIVVPSLFAFGEKGSSTGIIPPFTPLMYRVSIDSDEGLLP